MKLPSSPRLLCALLFASLLAPSVVRAAPKPGWTEDQAKALQQARVGKKLVLMDFTGSDWCIWCVKLDREVFSTPEFREYARKNLVLVELDFPRRKAVAPETKKQNEKLAERYRVEAFPTVIILNAAGKPVGQLGYLEGGPKVFIAALEKLPKA